MGLRMSTAPSADTRFRSPLDCPKRRGCPVPNAAPLLRRFSKTLTAAVSVRAFLDGKKKSSEFPSKRRVRVHLQVGDQVEHETGRWIFKERRVDKDASPAWYFERITDPETGKVIHECSEPLERHTGHGSARNHVEDQDPE